MTKRKIILILSGEIAAGKSTLAQNLVKKFDFVHLSTRDALKKEAQIALNELEPDRAFLQKFGEELDKKTNGSWVRQHFQLAMKNNEKVVIDSVRILKQIKAFRESYGSSVFHIHLVAPPQSLKQRFLDRNKSQDFSTANALEKYEKYKSDPTEKKVQELATEADLVIDTGTYQNGDDTLICAASFLKLLPRIDTPLVDIIIGGQFGSEGKGQVSAYLAPEYDCLVRVGGPNAGHKVYSEPSSFTFHLLPSGSVKSPNSKIIIGPGAVISEELILNEILNFGIDSKRLIIDHNATIISDSDRKWEQKYDKIGSTKQGVGKATSQNILNRIKMEERFKAKNRKKLSAYIGSAHEEYENIFSQNKKILLEGTQGTLLSLHHGFFPFVTSRDTTVSGCLAEAGISPRRVRKIVMVVRRYPIRVQNPAFGNSGPFFSRELTYEELAERCGLSLEDIKTTEITSTSKKQRRIAEFNWALFRRACEMNSPTDIALTFADYIDEKNRLAMRFDQLTQESTRFISEMERCAGVPVSLIATKFDYRSIIDRRTW